MKQKTKSPPLSGIFIALVLALVYMLYNPRVVKVPTQPQLPLTPRPVSVRREPEFRGPPIQKYKPGQMQQMGILTGPGETTMPLYGKEDRGRRER